MSVLTILAVMVPARCSDKDGFNFYKGTPLPFFMNVFSMIKSLKSYLYLSKNYYTDVDIRTCEP